MAKSKGPVPVNPIAAAIKVAIRKKEEERAAALAKSQGKEMTSTGSAAIEKNYRPKMVDEMRERMAGPSQREAKSSRADMVKQGFFVEKDGDLFPTKKYEEYKKTGKLKGITNFQ